MEIVLFLACLAAICVIAALTVANDRRENGFGSETKRPNAGAREKAPHRSRFFRPR